MVAAEDAKSRDQFLLFGWRRAHRGSGAEPNTHEQADEAHAEKADDVAERPGRNEIRDILERLILTPLLS